jgi:hypothetical protein
MFNLSPKRLLISVTACLCIDFYSFDVICGALRTSFPLWLTLLRSMITAITQIQINLNQCVTKDCFYMCKNVHCYKRLFT